MNVAVLTSLDESGALSPDDIAFAASLAEEHSVTLLCELPSKTDATVGTFSQRLDPLEIESQLGVAEWTVCFARHAHGFDLACARATESAKGTPAAPAVAALLDHIDASFDHFVIRNLNPMVQAEWLAKQGFAAPDVTVVCMLQSLKGLEDSSAFIEAYPAMKFACASAAITAALRERFPALQQIVHVAPGANVPSEPVAKRLAAKRLAKHEFVSANNLEHDRPLVVARVGDSNRTSVERILSTAYNVAIASAEPFETALPNVVEAGGSAWADLVKAADIVLDDANHAEAVVLAQAHGALTVVEDHIATRPFIIHADAHGASGDGLVFSNGEAGQALQLALALVARGECSGVQHRGMLHDRSWRKTARRVSHIMSA